MPCPITVTKFIGTVSLGLLTVSIRYNHCSCRCITTNCVTGRVLLYSSYHYSNLEGIAHSFARRPRLERCQATLAQTRLPVVKHIKHLPVLRVVRRFEAEEASLSDLGILNIRHQLLGG